MSFCRKKESFCRKRSERGIHTRLLNIIGNVSQHLGVFSWAGYDGLASVSTFVCCCLFGLCRAIHLFLTVSETMAALRLYASHSNYDIKVTYYLHGGFRNKK